MATKTKNSNHFSRRSLLAAMFAGTGSILAAEYDYTKTLTDIN